MLYFRIWCTKSNVPTIHVCPFLNSKTPNFGVSLPHDTYSQHVRTGFQRCPILQTWTGPENLPKFMAHQSLRVRIILRGLIVFYSNINRHLLKNTLLPYLILYFFISFSASANLVSLLQNVLSTRLTVPKGHIKSRLSSSPRPLLDIFRWFLGSAIHNLRIQEL